MKKFREKVVCKEEDHWVVLLDIKTLAIGTLKGVERVEMVVIFHLFGILGAYPFGVLKSGICRYQFGLFFYNAIFLPKRNQAPN